MNSYLQHISFKEPTDLEFIKRLTTPTGILQHTKYAVPDRFEGYSADDNARALILTLKDHLQFKKHQSLNLALIYLSYLGHSKTFENWFYTYQTFDHQFKKDQDEDAFGRAVWALGFAVGAKVRWDITHQAESIFLQVKDNFSKLKYPRAKAYTLLGCLYLQNSERKNSEIEELTRKLAEDLASTYEKKATLEWSWFEDTLTYDNGLLPLAMLKAGQYFKNDSYLRIGIESLGFLSSQSVVKGKPSPVGNKGWFRKGQERALYDQQPIDACSLVLANAEAYRAAGKANYKESAKEWFSWFLGNNLQEAPLFDPQIGGCFDGLKEDGVNMNQGAESTLVYWLAYLELVDLLKVGSS